MTHQQVGYARVSTQDQNLELQIDALQNHGCHKIFTDHLSGSKDKDQRPGLKEALNYLREGDSLVVWRLDRLGRSLQHLIEIAQHLERHNMHLVVLQEKIDTSSAGGTLFFHLFGALAEFERSLIRERTLAGLQAARARGRLGGRPKSLTQKQVELAQEMLKHPQATMAEVAEAFQVSKMTLYRYLKK